MTPVVEDSVPPRTYPPFLGTAAAVPLPDHKLTRFNPLPQRPSLRVRKITRLDHAGVRFFSTMKAALTET
jgi:hypothetical protein